MRGNVDENPTQLFLFSLMAGAFSEDQQTVLVITYNLPQRVKFALPLREREREREMPSLLKVIKTDDDDLGVLFAEKPETNEVARDRS